MLVARAIGPILTSASHHDNCSIVRHAKISTVSPSGRVWLNKSIGIKTEHDGWNHDGWKQKFL